MVTKLVVRHILEWNSKVHTSIFGYYASPFRYEKDKINLNLNFGNCP